MNLDIYKWTQSLQSITSKYFMLAGVAFLVFYILFTRKFVRLRIQKTFPQHKDYFRDVGFSLLSMIILGTTSYVVLVMLRPYTNIHYGTIGQYGTGHFFLSFGWMFLLHDTYFYWMHRFMHLPWLLKHVHRVHHLSTNPSPWTAYAFHPVEAILEAGIIPLVAFTIPVHRTAFTVFMIFQLTYNIYGHLGYELFSRTFLKSSLGRLLNTSTAHNIHHKYFNGNYGLYTLIWDRLMKTVNQKTDEILH